VEYHDGTDNTSILMIGVDTTAMVASDNYKDGNLSFCVRADLTGRSDDYTNSIMFTETVITLKFDKTGDFKIKSVAIDSIDSSNIRQNETFYFNIDAWICEVKGNSATCLDNRLNQNKEFEVCVFYLSDAMMIDSVEEMTMIQDEEVKVVPVKDK